MEAPFDGLLLSNIFMAAYIETQSLISVYSLTFKTIRCHFIFPKKCKSVLYFLGRIFGAAKGGGGEGGEGWREGFDLTP